MTAPAADLLAGLPFRPDRFQVEAVEAIAAGQNVVVTAPTGAGKTVIAEAAIRHARNESGRSFYTTPIKALSNQKYGDLQKEWPRVGLLTGDNALDGLAPVVVMTTEVLRNMIYAGSPDLDDVRVVVLDEVHYLGDRFRGPVWEEVLIHAPEHINFVCLSATIANAAEFRDWIEDRRGPTRLVQESSRPVPLHNLYAVRDLFDGGDIKVFDMFKDDKPNPRVRHLLAARSGRRRRFGMPRRIELVERLEEEELLPAIFFIFSREQCSQAAAELAGARPRSRHSSAIRTVALRRTEHLSPDDLTALSFDAWLHGLERGVAAHHAGLVPAFKETVEELFAAGLLDIVFATETLALGINMPARTVVLGSLTKYNGETHDLLRPSEYTQLTGRAGRRGIDSEGFAVSLWSRFVRFDQITRIAAAGANRLESSFRPTYNMAVNLVANYPKDEAEELVAASFAQHQLGQDRKRATDLLTKTATDLASIDLSCDLGDVEEYAAMVSDAPRTSHAAEVRPGDVLDLPSGSRSGRYVVLRRRAWDSDKPRLEVLSAAGKVTTIDPTRLKADAAVMGQIRVKGAFRPKDRRFRQQLTQGLRRHRGGDRRPVSAAPIVDHPVANCPDGPAHLNDVRRRDRLTKRVRRLEREQESGMLVAELDAVLDLLEEFGFTRGWSLTPSGELLRMIYSEVDLVVAQSLTAGHLHGLSASELAALCSAFVYEPRSDQPPGGWPAGELARRGKLIKATWEHLTAAEHARNLPERRPPDPGLALAVRLWASGGGLDEVTELAGIPPGDFVRVMRQTIDLLRQIRDVSAELADTCRLALAAVDRGVVAAGALG